MLELSPGMRNPCHKFHKFVEVYPYFVINELTTTKVEGVRLRDGVRQTQALHSRHYMGWSGARVARGCFISGCDAATDGGVGARRGI